MKLKPLGDRVVVKAKDDQDARTASGIVIPDTAKEKPVLGEVLAVGPGEVNDQGVRVPMDVKEGDTVVYSKYGGTEIKFEGQDYLILSSRDLLAIVA
ncbi:MAG TPA: co-chaperone GroES [Acidimicrobiia bacterium]|jgi:chaperonin GroES|nr:co-chaperone GroES [Acidimicrobiia bacterium]